jgi:hypothetical protein
MKSLTTEERRAVARRLFQALCAHYPDRYIALVEQPVSRWRRGHDLAPRHRTISNRYRIAANIAKLPELLKRRSVLLNASASGISRTPAVGPALLAQAGSGLADTVYHYPACATAHTGLRDHAVGLISSRERHRFRRTSNVLCSDWRGHHRAVRQAKGYSLGACLGCGNEAEHSSY